MNANARLVILVGLLLALAPAVPLAASQDPPPPGMASVHPSDGGHHPALPEDLLDLLPLPLSAAIRGGEPMGFHDAQVDLWQTHEAGKSGPSFRLPASQSHGSSPAVWDDDPFSLLERLTGPLSLDPGEPLPLGTRDAFSLLDPDQDRLLLAVLTTFHAALDAPDPVAARAHFALLASDPVLAGPLPAGPLLVDQCGLVYLDLSHTDNVHECDYLLMLDAGGDDLYHNNAGGSVHVQDGVPLPALALDLGGDDRFVGQVEQGGVAGGGHGNAAALVSLEGDDVFDTQAVVGAVNGGGHRGGAGLLVSGAGNDTYEGSVAQGGVNGGGGFGGVGFLMDLGGDDIYWGEVAAFGGTNGGSNDGVAGLVDLGGGDDSYDGRVGGRGGVNAGNEQGMTFLFDDGGHDRFDGHVSGGGVNGGAVGKAAAYLVSGGGDNVFAGSIGRHGGVNGGGYQAAALLLSLGEGDDVYRANATKTGAINGGGVLGEGRLVDDGGDDHYEAWVSGTGAVNGAGLWGHGGLHDLAGDDVYLATVLLQNAEELTGEVGAATNGGAHLGSGALVDQGGRDWYREGDAPGGWDHTVFPKGAFGMQLDLDPGGAP